MPFSNIISRSFDVVWRHRSLWVIGMIFAFFGGGGAGSSFNYSQGSGGGRSSGDGTMPAPDLSAWLTMENVILGVTVAVVLALVLGIISLVVQSIAHAGLIEGSDAAIDDKLRSWRDLWRAGLRGPWQSLFWLKILVGLPGLIAGLIGAAIALSVTFPLVQAAINQDESFVPFDEATFAAGIFGFVCLIACLVLFALVIQWVLSLAGTYAARAIVLEGHSLREGWSKGWQLFRTNMLNSFVMSILLTLLLAIAGLIVSIPLLILFAFTAIPLFFIIDNLTTLPIPVLVGGGFLFALAAAALSAVLSGPILAFGETAWNMTYRFLTGRELPGAPAATAPTPAQG